VNKLVSTMPEGTYIELVRGLFRTVLPASIMAFSFAATGALVSLQTRDPLIVALTILGTLTAAGRLAVLMAWRRTSAAETISLLEARRWERRFAIAYFLFAAFFSMFSCRAFILAAPDVHVLIVGLLFGYAAGVAAGVSFRPWISISAILIAVLPTIVVALSAPISAYRAVGCLLAVFTVGGIQSIISRYRYATASITTGLLFAALARSDPLTGLPNRLGLAESFHDITATIASRDALASIWIASSRSTIGTGIPSAISS
jgi:hypothetical protein